ncbi:MAG: NAD(+) synthase [Ndongobacter sp.]|nr:NAD(+) synthase [Ndongobacter sp.]
MNRDYFRAAAVTLPVVLGDPEENRVRLAQAIHRAEEQGAEAVVFPELSLCGVSVGDIVGQELFLQTCEEQLAHLISDTEDCALLCAAGLPVRTERGVFDAMAVFQKGRLLGLVPRTDFSEDAAGNLLRVFAHGEEERTDEVCFAGFEDVPFGRRLRFCGEGARIAVGAGAELLSRVSSVGDALAGACDVLLLGADFRDQVYEKARRRVRWQSETQSGGGVVIASSGMGESTTDNVWSGERWIVESGAVLAESEDDSWFGETMADLDLRHIRRDRLCPGRRDLRGSEPWTDIAFERRTARVGEALLRPVNAFPFVPQGGAGADAECERILRIQARGLESRMRHIGTEQVFLGVSGGLDSTLALLVCARAFDEMGLSREGIHGLTMPAFGTSERTHANARLLMERLGIRSREIDIRPALRQHFLDIQLPEGDHSVAFENAQARERTQILMDLANRFGGIVVGTGDMSEIALGWATYNGDHMSMYGVNSSVTKTLGRRLLCYEAGRASDELLRRTILDVVDTPVSPELLPTENGRIVQQTEKLVGPYELHDFFLFHVLRYGDAPVKLLRLAQTAFAGVYDRAEIVQWMHLFFRRFFTQQFKRNCSVDGVSVGAWSLSPRGGWQMPSDVSWRTWQREMDCLLEECPDMVK